MGACVHTEVTGRSLKAGLKWASKLGAAVTVILGENELASGTAVVRSLDRSEQVQLPLDEVASRVAELVRETES